VVSREELRRHLWPDGTFVDYEHSLNAAIKRLRAALADDASAPRFVETVPRRGYRWKASPARCGHPVRLAIMPFTADGAARAFSSGVTDELATQLGQRGRGCVQVISRLSASACGSTPQRASDVAAALGADYVMDGSVRADSRRARIAVWLVDAREEVQLWADAYERQLDEPLAVQVDVAAAVAESIVSVLRK
jgi:TolB-like protein